MKKHTFTLVAAAAALLTGSAAMAQTDLAALGGPELTPIVLNPGKIEVRVPLAIGLNSGDAGKPISLPVDVYYGVNDQLTIGLSHSLGTVQAVSPYPGGAGICLSGTPSCPKAYNNIGLDVLYRFLGPTIQLAAHGGLDFIRLSDPSALDLRLGVLFQAPLATNVALIADPRLSIGLTNRDQGNKGSLVVPIGVQFWANPNLRLAARTEIGGPLDNFSDYYYGTLGVFGGFTINQMIEAFASFDFTNLYGKNGSGDYRQLVIGVNLRF